MQSLEKKGEIIAREVASTFTNKSYVLNFVHRSHFMVRLYRTTKNDIFLNPIIEAFFIEKEKIINDFNNLSNNDYIKNRSIILFKHLKKQGGIKHIRRINLFKKHKEFLFYYHIIQNLYFWKVFGVNKSKLKKYYLKGIIFIKIFVKSKNFDKFFFDEEMIKYFSTQLVNCVYYLKFLNILNVVHKFTIKFKKVFWFKNDKYFTKYLYKNKIYGLTHFVIAGTNYYQRYALAKEFGWILSYFKMNIKEILKRTDPDIVSEVGLCFKLCKNNPKKELDMIRKYLIKNFNKRLGYIPRFKGSMNPSEHTAAVSYLFLSNFKKLYNGPNLQKNIDMKL